MDDDALLRHMKGSVPTRHEREKAWFERKYQELLREIERLGDEVHPVYKGRVEPPLPEEGEHRSRVNQWTAKIPDYSRSTADYRYTYRGLSTSYPIMLQTEDGNRSFYFPDWDITISNEFLTAMAQYTELGKRRDSFWRGPLARFRE